MFIHSKQVGISPTYRIGLEPINPEPTTPPDPETTAICLICGHTGPKVCVGCGGTDGYPPGNLPPCKSCILKGPKPVT